MKRPIMIAIIIILVLVLLAIILAAYFTNGFRIENNTTADDKPDDELPEDPDDEDPPSETGYLELTYKDRPVTSDALPEGDSVRIDVRSSSDYTVTIELNKTLAVGCSISSSAQVLTAGENTDLYTEQFNVRIFKDYFRIAISHDLRAIITGAIWLPDVFVLGSITDETEYFVLKVRNQDGLEANIPLSGFYWEEDISMEEEVGIG